MNKIPESFINKFRPKKTSFWYNKKNFLTAVNSNNIILVLPWQKLKCLSQIKKNCNTFAFVIFKNSHH